MVVLQKLTREHDGREASLPVQLSTSTTLLVLWYNGNMNKNRVPKASPEPLPELAN